MLYSMPKNVLLISMFVLFYSKKNLNILIYIYMNKKFEYDEEF